MQKADVARVLDALDAPAYVISESGAVVLENAAAKSCYCEPPAWLSTVVGDDGTTNATGLATVSRLEMGARSLWLVLPVRKISDGVRLGGVLLAGLPPSLRTVAELLLAGFSDREIAERTGLSVASARTYVSRLYRRLDVGGRGELLRKALGLEDTLPGDAAKQRD